MSGGKNLFVREYLDTSSLSDSTLPKVLFGAGSLSALVDEIQQFGSSVLIVSGRSFESSGHWPAVQESLRQAGVVWDFELISGEPGVDRIDQIVTRHSGNGHAAVVGIGGGSSLDAAKAIAALLPLVTSVLDFLEDVGLGLPYTGPSLPFIAVPTTAGTGSEMTKNAVLSGDGDNRFKKSFRDSSLIARVALIDPLLLASCPPSVKASNSMDAFTQLLESYVALGANPTSDAVAVAGIEKFLIGFSVEQEADLLGDEHLAYASMMSGVSLSQAGLGAVHGLASPLGGHFPIPHGVACGTLLAVTTEVNIRALLQRDRESLALHKYAHAGNIVSGLNCVDPEESCDRLLEILWRWTEVLNMARLGDYGVKSSDIGLIIGQCRGGSMRYNPLVLTDAELEEVLFRRL